MYWHDHLTTRPRRRIYLYFGVPFYDYACGVERYERKHPECHEVSARVLDCPFFCIACARGYPSTCAAIGFADVRAGTQMTAPIQKGTRVPLACVQFGAGSEYARKYAREVEPLLLTAASTYTATCVALCIGAVI